MSAAPLIESTPQGLYCPAGNFHIDPARKVERAIITHAHSDHVRPGAQRYLSTRCGLPLLRTRLGDKPIIEAVEYGQTVMLNGVTVSLHPAGHVLGSAQVRVEYQGRVAVVSGDYKLQADPTCAPFEPLRCHHFISEATFAQPVYRWPEPTQVVADLHDWWQCNQRAHRNSVVFCYSLGKAQRIQASVNAGIGPIFAHPDIEELNVAYEAAGVKLPRRTLFEAGPLRAAAGRALVLAPPMSNGSNWLRRFEPYVTAMASGWMLRPRWPQRNTLDAGFVLSDHADWAGLNHAIDATGAERVGVMHGFVDELVRHLRTRDRTAHPVATSHDRRRPPQTAIPATSCETPTLF